MMERFPLPFNDSAPSMVSTCRAERDMVTFLVQVKAEGVVKVFRFGKIRDG
jgi:hypothetical protein